MAVRAKVDIHVARYPDIRDVNVTEVIPVHRRSVCSGPVTIVVPTDTAQCRMGNMITGMIEDLDGLHLSRHGACAESTDGTDSTKGIGGIRRGSRICTRCGWWGICETEVIDEYQGVVSLVCS